METKNTREEEAARRPETASGDNEQEQDMEAAMEEADECRICRSSAEELQDAEATAGGCGLCRRQARTPPLHRLHCACAGSVCHVCDRCYRRYYVARGLTVCEICRRPTGLEGDVRGHIGGGAFRHRLASFACSDEARFLAYALFIVTAFVSIFALFFVASAADAADSAASASGTTATTPQPNPQRQLERTIFVAIASLNLGVALAYIGYSYWRRCHGGECCGRRRGRGREGQRRRREAAGGGVPQQDASIAIESITVTIRQQPQTSLLPPLPPLPLAPSVATVASPHAC